MKKFISFILVVVSLLSIIPTAHVSAQCKTDSAEIIYLDDGGYILVDVDTAPGIARTTVTKNKNYTRYSSDDEMQWKITLTGSFTYNGVTSSCTSCNCTVTIYVDAWYTSSKTSWVSGNTANATVELGRKLLGVTVKRETVNLTLTCDKNGNFS